MSNKTIEMNKNFTIIIITICFFIKIFFGFYLININPEFFILQDSISYIDPSKKLCEIGKFYDKDNIPVTFRVPGMSIFLMPAVCFGIDLNYYILIINSILLLLIAYLTYKIIELMKINTSLLFIFLFFWLDPTLLRYQFSILSEIPFLFVFTLALFFFSHAIIENKPFYIFNGLVMISLATFIRPVTLYMPFVLLLFFVFKFIFKKSFKGINKYSLLIILIGVLVHYSVTQLWIHRNYTKANIKEFSTVKNINLYYYMTPGIIAKGEKKNWINVRKERQEKYQDLSTIEHDRKISNIAVQDFKINFLKYPVETIRVGLEGAFMTFFTPGTGQFARMLKVNEKNFQQTKYTFIILGMIWIMFIWSLSVYGFIKIQKNDFFLFLLIVLIYFVLVSSGPHSYSRYRIQFFPILVIFASVGLEKLIKNIRKF